MAQLIAPALDITSPADFAILLAAQMPTLHALARRYTRSGPLAEDLVQDTAVRALTYQQSFRSGSNFRAWICTVMTNTFLNRYRRTKREHAALYTNERFDVMQNLRSEQTRRETREPEKVIMDKAFDDDVTRALANLAPEFRAAIELCDVAGISYKEASAQLGCPIGTIMSRLYRGRRQLKAALAATGQARGLGQASRPSKVGGPSRGRALAPRRRSRQVLAG